MIPCIPVKFFIDGIVEWSVASIRLIFSVLLVLMLRGNEEIAKIVTQVTENLSRAETWAQLIQKEEFVLFAEQVAKAARDLDRGEMMIVPAKVAVLPEDAEEWAMILVWSVLGVVLFVRYRVRAGRRPAPAATSPAPPS